MNYTTATVDNMRIATATYGSHAMVVSLYTDEEYSGNANDYLNRDKNDPLLDSEGFPMILVYRETAYCDAATGEKI